MPVRYGSQSALNKSGDGMYPDDRQHPVYRSSPDLSQRSDHQRSSSNDSLDGSYQGSHSRQSSGSNENYPTRPHRRTSSSTGDPLQFVKFHRQTDLAKQAEEQMKIAATQKEHKVVKEDKEDDDWQSNLSSWKNRRKSQSSHAYQLKEDLEAQHEQKEEVKTTLQTKTFSQMQQERERRKSAGTRNFYPLEENDDEMEGISATRGSQQETSHTDDKTQVLYKSSNMADWAQDSEGEEKEDNNNNDNNNNNNMSKDDENGMNEDPFDDPVGSPRNKPSTTEKHFGDTDRDNTHYLPSDYISLDVSKQNSRNSHDSGSKLNKISDIRNRFEHADEQPKTRSSTVDTKVDLKARLKSFESFDKENENTVLVPPSRVGMSDMGMSRRSDSSRGQNSFRESVTKESYSRSYNHDKGSTGSQISDLKSNRNVYSSLRTSGRDYTEKTIKISQKTNSEKGFGFTVSGGMDTQEPVTVLKVALGSAADVCEVMAKDEILAINKCDISGKTNQEVNQLIQDAVRSGQLELRVKRFLGSHDEDEDDFLSSDEEVESLERSRNSTQRTEDIGRMLNDSQDSRTSQEDFRAAVNNNPVASALEEERQWLTNQLDYGEPAPQSEDTSDGSSALLLEDYRPPSVEPKAEPYIDSVGKTSDETRPSVTARREKAEVSLQGDTKSVDSSEDKTFEVEHFQTRNSANHGGSSGDDFGPPAILRKWQRQRPQSEYTFEREKSPDKRLSSTLPWMDNKVQVEQNRTTDDLMPERVAQDFNSPQSEPPIPSPRRRFDDQKKLEEWNLKHEQIRQPANRDHQLQQNQREFQEQQSKHQEDYNTELARAQELARHRQKQESHLLEPEMERMRITEERRQERRMRQQFLQQSADTPVQSGHHISTVQAHSANKNRSSMTFHVQGQAAQQVHDHSGILVIDPRNREDDDYNFHVNISQIDGTTESKHIQPQLHSYQPGPIDIEAIREEERRKIREEEQRKREEEEDMRFKEKEAQLREQEEQLRRKEEQLRQEQERFHREQEELQKIKVSSEHNPEVMKYEAPVYRVREASPSYHSTITKKGSKVLRTNTSPQYSTTVVVEPKPHYTVKPVPPTTEAIRSSTDPSGRSRYSREDMLAMNRKATPLQTRPDITPPTSPTGTGPIKRTSLSREQVHSLNAVPKPRFISSQDWIGSDQTMQHNSRSTLTRHSDIMKKQYATPQEHWLFEEAERRRRMASQDPQPHSRQTSHSHFSGPIKPTADNRWREEPVIDRRNSATLNTSFDRPHVEGNMPAAIRQTLLQKTAGARGSTGSNYSQDLGVSYNQYPSQSLSMSHTLPASYSYSSHSFRGQEDQVPPATRAPPPPDPNSTPITLSGRQLCSHCNQELGFGAAMIIESLGLSYHVQCFKCCVCHTPLGSGNEGADVRVRVNKLHCPNCYSNDEAGLKFSKV